MGVHNGKILTSYRTSNEGEVVNECNISSESWLGMEYHGGEDFSWLEHSQWQPFAILCIATFELIVLQMITPQFSRTNRIFTWHVKLTCFFAMLEFITVFLLNCFLASIIFGHSLYLLLIVIHLFIIDLCVMRIYCLMTRHIADLAHLKSRNYYESVKYKTQYKCFFIPVIFLLHVMVVIEVIYTVSIFVETILVNQCWVMTTYRIKYHITELDVNHRRGYTNGILMLNACRQIVGMTSLWYLVIVQLGYSLKEWMKEKEAKETSGNSVMQESDDITAPLMKNGQADN